MNVLAAAEVEEVVFTVEVAVVGEGVEGLRSRVRESREEEGGDRIKDDEARGCGMSVWGVWSGVGVVAAEPSVLQEGVTLCGVVAGEQTVVAVREEDDRSSEFGRLFSRELTKPATSTGGEIPRALAVVAVPVPFCGLLIPCRGVAEEEDGSAREAFPWLRSPGAAPTLSLTPGAAAMVVVVRAIVSL